MFQKLLLFCTILIPLISTAQEEFKTEAQFSILQDYETGTILQAKNPDERMYPASMTKMMTAYVIFEELKAKRISLMDEFKVSEKAYSLGGSSMFLEVGKKVLVKDLLLGIIVQSGNDASVVAAENIAGFESGFAVMMNDVAAKLGMKNSNFVNASGWPDENQYTTARDLMILAKATLDNFPEYYSYYAEKEFTYADITQFNRNPLFKLNIGADGLKTGHTEASGYGMVASAVLNDKRLILVVNGLNSEQQRKNEAAKLIEWGFVRFENYRLFLKGDEVGKANVALSPKTTIPLSVNENVVLALPKADKKILKSTLIYDSPLQAPITVGQQVGSLELSARGKIIKKVSIYAAEDAKKSGFFDKIAKFFKNLMAP